MAWCRLPCCVFRACIWLLGLSPGLKKSRAAPGWVSWCWGRKGRWISSWEEGQLLQRKVQLSCSLGTGLSRGDCTQGNSKAAAAARVTDCSSKLLAKRAREMRASRGRRVKQPDCCWCTHLESHHKLGLLTSAPNIQCKCFSRGSLWAQFMISVMKTSFLLIKSTGQCVWDIKPLRCHKVQLQSPEKKTNEIQKLGLSSSSTQSLSAVRKPHEQWLRPNRAIKMSTNCTIVVHHHYQHTNTITAPKENMTSITMCIWYQLTKSWL